VSRNLSPEFTEALARACVTACADAKVIGLRAAGQALDDTTRAELIERSLRGEHVELELDLVAYVQIPGVRNRNCIRFKPGRLQSMARTGVGTPFLRNHAQYDVMSAGGTIAASKLVKSGAGKDERRELHQTARLTVPWAVQAALQGVLGKFSIGWWPTAAVHCSLCDAPIQECLWKRGHWRGSEHDGAIVEFVFQDAELVETSAVNVPAVPETGVRGIRSAGLETWPTEDLDKLQAIDSLFALGAVWTVHANQDQPHIGEEHTTMADSKSALARINPALGLQAEASEEATLAAVSALVKARDDATRARGLAESQLADVSAARDAAVAERDTLAAEKAALVAQTREQGADEFVARAVEQGKCPANGATAGYFRTLYLQNQAAAEESLAAAPVVTPVGQGMQSDKGRNGGQQGGGGKTPGVPDYARLATQLSAADAKNAMRAGVSAEAYTRANYGTLAGEYGWPILD
jgi:hypothetical protein